MVRMREPRTAASGEWFECARLTSDSFRLRDAHPDRLSRIAPQTCFASSHEAKTGAKERGLAVRPHLRLQIVLNADFVDQLELRLEIVDVFFGVFKNMLEELP